MRTHARTILTTLSLTAVAGTFAGCGSAQHARYREHVSIVLEPNGAPDQDFVVAFNLDGATNEPFAVAAAE